MKRSRERFGSLDDTWTRDDEMLTRENFYAPLLHGRYRCKRAPHTLGLRDVRRREQSRRPNFEDDVRRACQHRLDRRLHRLAGDVSEDVHAACDAEHVVEKANAAADVDATQRRGIALEDQQRLRFRSTAYACLYRIEPAADVPGKPFGISWASDSRAEILERCEYAVQTCVAIAEYSNVRAGELRLHIGLRSVAQDEIWA